MRHHHIPIPAPSSPSLPWAMRWLVWVGATATTMVGATPYPRDDLHHVGSSFLMPRNCASYCGADNQFCCEQGQACTTLEGNVATCLPGAWGGSYTTTWTVTYTSIIMTNWIPAPAPTPGVDCVPQAPEQEACGRICCAGWQQCAYKTNGGQCTPRAGYPEPSAVVVTSNGQTTTRYAAPYRVIGTTVIVNSGLPSSQATSTATSTAAATAANPTSTSDGNTIGADGSNKGGTGGGLSPGAIAGIVIGTLAGVALLMLLCFCCIARGIWHAMFGGKKKDDKVVVEEERYSRHGSRVPSAYSRRDRHSGWFGGRPASASDRREKKSDGKWWLGIAGGAATLLTLLNLKKKDKPARKPAPSSRYSDSYYTYSDATDMTTQAQEDEATAPDEPAAATVLETPAAERHTTPVPLRADHRVAAVRPRRIPSTPHPTLRIRRCISSLLLHEWVPNKQVLEIIA
ncbi:hypothetical protein EsDP_00002742 [Epichloe bromicola]|uniref:Glycophorin A domain-containing protein n=1 Tax=Epichloe bromicola TaxID=79588 RepID=A0ABQ0CLQ6_9HYPO